MAHHGNGVVRLALIAALVAVPSAALAQTPAGDDVTFTKDIAPILQRSCQACHRQGEMAPMSLVTYQEVRPWARSIKNRVVNREMPPWHIDKNIGIQKFKNDTSLSDEEIALIAGWVDNGAPMGNPEDMPPPVEFADSGEWQIGEPDLVVQFPAYPVPAEGPDLFGNIYTDLELDSDRYIKAIQTRVPDDASRRVVHHALSFAVEPDEQQMREAGETDIPAAMFLVEYASGKLSEIYPENSGLLLESWRKMRLDYHLHSVGEDVDAKVELGMVFHPEGHVPEHIRWSKQLGQHVTDLDIPPGKVVRTDGYTYFHKAARITAFQPHMHALGTYQCLELIYPTHGTPAETELVSCAHWDYNWHMVYNYADDVAPIIPAGTVAHVISWHDNTEALRSNPDPKNWTGNGGRTIDEMAFVWLGWYDMTDEEYEAEIAERRALQEATAATDQQQQ
ncbi:MAG: cytochrome c [Acidobacteria bacterium]|nr:cytochrome c [Acidobacteriota bacterium]